MLSDEEIHAEWRKHTSQEGFTTAQFVRNFARAIEAAVIERCAQVCDELGSIHGDDLADRCAAAIRGKA